MKTQSRLDVLSGYLNLWVHITNKQYVAATIVENLHKYGFEKTLEAEGITFTQRGDISDEARKNAQKLWRWFGGYEGTPINKERLFDLEQVIVASFPLEMRVAYLTAVYGDFDVAVSPVHYTMDNQLDISRMVQTMMKEDTEAHLAVMDFVSSNHDPAFIDKTRIEIREAISVHLCVLKELDTVAATLPGSH